MLMPDPPPIALAHHVHAVIVQRPYVFRVVDPAGRLWFCRVPPIGPRVCRVVTPKVLL